MRKILIIANDFTTIYHFRVELIQRLITEGFAVILSLPPDERNKVFLEMSCIVEESNLERFGKNPIQELSMIRDYVKLIRKNNPDLVLTFTMKPNMYGGLACQICRIPYISNVTGLGIAFQIETLLKKLLMFLQKLAFKKASCIFFQNSTNKKFFEKTKIVASQSKLLPGSGVNLELHQYEDYPSDNLTIKFITISRARKDKGFDELFDAIQLISKQKKNAEFHIVGWIEEEHYQKRIEQMVREYPVIYHGSCSPNKVHQLLAQSHCLIHPSHHEGMSNVILEASATGRPCIVSDIPGCQEAIEHNKTGFLVQVKNTESLQQAIQNFLTLSPEKMKEMGKFARAKMEREYDRQLVINEYMKQINMVLDKNKELSN